MTEQVKAFDKTNIDATMSSEVIKAAVRDALRSDH
jgi:hypothetical protein